MDAHRRDADEETPSHLFAPETFTLDNGMRAIVVANHRAPVVTHWVWYDVGCADSPVGKSGLAHFLEHLMFKGTEKIPPGEFSKIVARHGGQDNAMTSQDFTAYYQTIAQDRLPLVMEMEADRMANLRLSDDDVYPERDVIIEERKQRVDNDPTALLQEQIGAAQFLHQPYRLPVIGWLHEIEGYTREDAEAFYRAWYAPNNATLVVVGDVLLEEVKALAARTYGAIAARPVPKRTRLGEPPPAAARRIEVADQRVQQPSLVRSWLAPSHASTGREHATALEVLSELLGGGSTSRLYRGLVVERGLAAGAAGWYSGAALGETMLRVSASPRPGIELDALETALDQEIARAVDGDMGEAEIARVKRRMIAEATFDRDSLGAAARAFGVTVTTGGTTEDVERWPARIAAVTVDGIKAAARLVLDPKRSVTGRLLPAASGAAS